MIYISKDRQIHVVWSIFRGTSDVHEDFSRALVKVFLIGNYEKYLLEAVAEGGNLVFDIPQGLPEGAYSLEAIWVKNYNNLLPSSDTLTPSVDSGCRNQPLRWPFKHPHDHRFNDRCIMRSRKDYVFALTEYDSESTFYKDSGDADIKIRSAVATYGYDGLSAYEIAVLRGDFNGTEGEYLDSLKFKLEVAQEHKLGGITAVTKTDDETEEVKVDPETGRLYVKPGGGSLSVATETKLGGIKAANKTDNETVEAKIGSDGKLYVPKGSEELKAATETTLGGIKAATKTSSETVEVKIGSDGKLYVPKGGEELKAATETTLGGIKAATKTSLDTQEVKIDPVTGKLYTQPGGEGGVEIVNNPDEEDLHSIEKSADVHVLQFADKEYNESSFSGLGRVYLRKNISGGKNVLTQAMMNKANTRYIIQYDYDLDGATITMPTGCTLDFQGGGLKNGTISGNNTKISSGLQKIFHSGIILSGNWNVIEIYPEWLGAKGDGVSDDTNVITGTIALAKNLGCKPWVKLCGTYLITDTIYLPQFIKIAGNSSPSFTFDSGDPNIRYTFIANFPEKKKAVLESDTLLNRERLAYNELVGDTDFDEGNATKTIGIYIKDISINAIGTGEHDRIYSAIKLSSSPSSIIDNVFTKGTIIGIFGSAMWTTVIRNCYILAYGYGIYSQSMNNGGLFNNYIDGYDTYSPFEFQKDEQIKDVYYEWNQDSSYGFGDSINKSYAIVLNYGTPICMGNTMEGWYGGYLIFRSQITLISDYFEKITDFGYNMSYATGMIQNPKGYSSSLPLIRNSAYNNINIYNYTGGKMSITSSSSTEAQTWSKINLTVPETKLSSIPFNPVLNVEPVVDMDIRASGANDYKGATLEYIITRNYKAHKAIIPASTTVSTPDYASDFVRDVIIEGKGNTSVINITNTVTLGDHTIVFKNLKITGNIQWLFSIRNATVVFDKVTFDYTNNLSYHYDSPIAKVTFRNCKFSNSKKLFSSDTESNATIYLDVQNTDINTAGSTRVTYKKVAYEDLAIS